MGTLLLCLVLGISIPLLLFALGTVWRMWSIQIRQRGTALIDQERDTSQRLDRALERLQDGLSSTAASSALGRNDLNAFAREAHLFADRMGGTSITLAAPDGTVLIAANRSDAPSAKAPLPESVREAIRATNARDAMPNGGVLSLRAAREVVADGDPQPHPGGISPGNYIRLSAVDEETGMSNATIARAGEPFFTTKDVGKGTGLGLSIVKAFADQSGGGKPATSAVLGARVAAILGGH